jgi:hypothetical protein
VKGRDGHTGEIVYYVDRWEKECLRVWGIVLEFTDDLTEFGKDLCLTERKFGILRFIVEDDDHVLDLGRRYGKMEWGGESK